MLRDPLPEDGIRPYREAILWVLRIGIVYPLNRLEGYRYEPAIIRFKAWRVRPGFCPYVGLQRFGK